MRRPRLVQRRDDGTPVRIKCRCRSIVEVPAEGSTCLCGRRYQQKGPAPVPRQVVIHGGER